MLELWIPITIVAAFFQNLRSALQKHIKGKLSTVGAAYARFFYAWPLAVAFAVGLHLVGGYAWPTPNVAFFVYCTLGGLTQILFTVLLLWMFSFKSFAVGTTFSKLEVIMVAFLGAVLLGDGLSYLAMLAVVISAFGVVALSIGQSRLTWASLWTGLAEKTTLIGLASAAFLGASSVLYRGALLALESDNFVMSAVFGLSVSLVIQTLVMGAYLVWREPGELVRVIRHWRWAGAVGVAGMLASVAWFTAFTLQNAAYVRALGQIELVFTFLAATLVFHEKVERAEIIGIVLIAGAILLLVLGA